MTFDLLNLKVVSETCVTWATPVPILVFLGLTVLDLGSMYATDRRQTASSLMPPPIRGGDIITGLYIQKLQYTPIINYVVTYIQQAVREAATICPRPL